MSDEKAEEGIRSRLELLVKKYSQAEISRKTGVSSPNVRRYVNGTRIPAQFCVALVETMGVNATWLLTGEGAPSIMEETEGEDVATNVLGLVESMTTALRMPLGVISGSSYAKSLRVLNETLETHQILQQRLNDVSAAQFKRLLSDMDEALDELRLSQAEQIRNAALRLRTFCSDPELNREFADHQSHLELHLGHPDKALDFMQEVVQHCIINHQFPDDESLKALCNKLMLTGLAGYMQKALTIVDSLTILGGREFKQSKFGPIMFALSAEWLMNLGSLKEALDRFHNSIHYLEDTNLRTAKCGLIMAQLLAGEISVHDAILISPHYIRKANACLRVAIFNENVEEIEAALQYRGSDKIERLYEDTTDTIAATHITKALRASRKPSGSAKVTGNAVSEAYADFHTAVLQSKVYIVSKKKELALKSVLKAEKLLSELSEGVVPYIIFAAMHCINILAATKPSQQQKLRARAKTCLIELIDNGYNLFNSERIQ